jgi:hypothetical protein
VAERAKALPVTPTARGGMVMAQGSRSVVPFLEARLEEPPRAMGMCRSLLLELPGGARLQVAELAHVPWALELVRGLQTPGGGGIAC